MAYLSLKYCSKLASSNLGHITMSHRFFLKVVIDVVKMSMTFLSFAWIAPRNHPPTLRITPNPEDLRPFPHYTLLRQYMKILLLANDLWRFVLPMNIFFIFYYCKITEFKGFHVRKYKNCVKAETETYKIQTLYCGFPSFD